MIGRVISILLALALVAACVNVNPTPTPTPALTPGASTTPLPPTTTPTAGQTPSATATPGSSAGPSGEPTSPPASMDPELAAQINAVIATVPAVRELEATRDVPFEVITRDQFRADIEELVLGETPLSWRQAEERLYKRLGLLPADADMEAQLEELYGTQVAAFYRPDNGRFYIIARDQPFGGSDKIVVSHEYTHALQDQHFDLEGNRIKDLAEGDAVLAQLAVIEGDATLTSQNWAFGGNLTQEELFAILMEALGMFDDQSLAGFPLILRRQLEFPYGEGLLFTQSLWENGGYEAVNAAIETPPASTEQILHPEKYNADPALSDAPVVIPADDLSTTLGDGWTRAYEATFGELLIQVLAAGGEAPDILIPGLPVEWPHQEVAAGWDGDRLQMFESVEGSWFISWQTAWDTPADASAFEARMQELAGTFGGPVRVEENNGQVLVRIASREELLFDCCR